MENNKNNSQWHQFNFVVIDIEGTGGQDKENEEILEIAAFSVTQGKLEKKSFFHSLINPQRSIRRYPWVYITNEDVKDAPIFNEIKLDLVNYLGKSILIGHNVNVDWRLLKRKLPGYEPIILDTLKLSRKLYSGYKKHSLDDLIERFNLKDTQTNTTPLKRHRALYDAMVTGEIFLKIVNEKFANEVTLGELIELCGIEVKEVKQDTLF
ncbi:3'-5' exonuclease [Bacillus wiedmannii]|uniref:3'-5' exonuclease n=1 Tax=Bacillus wiedmannii TaxID=1890302 RepID=UPI000BFB65A4|nr:3'-5' exonuclease [Bacillus wiedmannii]PHF04989.1 hypothetical protein COF74_27095 [Bacillus wiedmannii]